MSCPIQLLAGLTPQLVDEITRYMIVRTQIRKADLCFLFGSSRSMQARVQVALKLWRDGLVARILVTGGQVTGTGQLEAEVMCEGLVAAGVPEEKIVLETRATNTGENVRFSIELLKQLDLYDDIHSVIAVGSASASRRYLMTLERYWPDLVKMLMASNRYPVSADKWHEHPEFAADVLREWNKIQPYLDAGYLKELSPQTCPLID